MKVNFLSEGLNLNVCANTGIGLNPIHVQQIEVVDEVQEEINYDTDSWSDGSVKLKPDSKQWTTQFFCIMQVACLCSPTKPDAWCKF